MVRGKGKGLGSPWRLRRLCAIFVPCHAMWCQRFAFSYICSARLLVAYWTARQVHSTNTMMLQTVEQAHDKAAALGKALYSQLFLWLVAKLNTTISAPQRYLRKRPYVVHVLPSFASCCGVQ